MPDYLSSCHSHKTQTVSLVDIMSVFISVCGVYHFSMIYLKGMHGFETVSIRLYGSTQEL
jgi:hypothetical protein